MKKIGILMFIILGILVFTTSKDDTEDNDTNSIDTPKKTYLDSSTNTYKKRVEALSISNTLQNPVNTYLDGRVDAMGKSRKSVIEANKRMEEQNKAMESLTK
jgi:hypothetical protein